jgi:hypothetical protein
METEKQTLVTPTPRAYWDNGNWMRQHLTELHQQYEGKWVAIADRQVVAVGMNPRRVEDIAVRRTGHSPAEIYMKYLEPAGAIYGSDWALV